MIQGAIFDADGTILDSMSVWNHLAGEYVESLGLQPPEGLNEKLKTCSMPQAVRLIRETCRLEATESQIMQGIYSLIQQDYYEKVQLKPGVYSFVKLLKENGLRCCIATSTDAFLIAGALKRLKLEQDFEFILTSREIGCSKDRPDIYIEAAHRLHLPLDEVMVFEDALFAARTAFRAGLYVVGVYDPAHTDQSELKQLAHGFTRDFSNYETWRIPDLLLIPDSAVYQPYRYDVSSCQIPSFSAGWKTG